MGRKTANSNELNNIFSTKNDAIDLKLDPNKNRKAIIAKITIVFFEGGLKFVVVRTLAMRTC